MNRTARAFRIWHVFVLLLVLCIAVSSFMIGVSASRTKTDGIDTRVTAAINEENTDEIKVVFIPDDDFLKEKKGQTLYLFCLQPYVSVDELRSLSPLATKVVDKKVTYTIPVDDAEDRYRARFVLALGSGADYQVVGEAFVGNPEALDTSKKKRMPSPSIKGVVASSSLMSDVQQLGVSHVVIPIVIDDFITETAGDPSYSEVTSGTTTHFHKELIDVLDAQVQMLKNRGTQIYFRFLLDGGDREDPLTQAYLLYAETASEDAAFYGISMQTKKAYQIINNLFTFFADRYAADTKDAQVDFILGYHVNEWEKWCDLGYSSKSVKKQAEAYAAVFRVAKMALQSVSASSRVYVPNSNLYPSAKIFLEAFASEMGMEDWSVAIAPYASTPLHETVWSDNGAAASQSTSYLTMKNIELLRDFLMQDAYLHNGQMRSVIIDDFAVHGVCGESASEENQAASIAYAYYRAEAVGFIDAMIYHRIIDNANEGCRLGLRGENGEEKRSYTLFAKIDTNMGSEIAKPYAQIIGQKKWSNIVDGYSKKAAEPLSFIESQGEIIREDALLSHMESSVALYTFELGTLQGFRPAEHGVSAVLETEEVTGIDYINSRVLAIETASMPSTEYAGFAVNLGADKQITDRAERLYLSLNAGTVADDGVRKAERFSVKLVLGSKDLAKDRCIYEGVAEIEADTWTTVSFDIKDFARRADGASYLMVLVAGDDESEGNRGAYRILLNDIRMTTGAGTLPLKIFLTVLGLIGAVALLFGLLVLRAAIIRRRRRKQRAAYLAKQRRLRMQQQYAAQMQLTERRTGTASAVQKDMRTKDVHTQQNRTPPSEKRRVAQRRPDMYKNDRRS